MQVGDVQLVEEVETFLKKVFGLSGVGSLAVDPGNPTRSFAVNWAAASAPAASAQQWGTSA